MSTTLPNIDSLSSKIESLSSKIDNLDKQFKEMKNISTNLSNDVQQSEASPTPIALHEASRKAEDLSTPPPSP
jgi:hypothetical protein